jgi:hypothetical protein
VTQTSSQQGQAAAAFFIFFTLKSLTLVFLSSFLSFTLLVNAEAKGVVLSKEEVELAGLHSDMKRAKAEDDESDEEEDSDDEDDNEGNSAIDRIMAEAQKKTT